MAWIVLVVSGLFEAVWATALDRIHGPSDVGPVAAFVLGSIVSLGGLWWALRDIPVSTGYAVWVGVGVAATTLWNVFAEGESASVPKFLLIAGILACVLGLKLLPDANAA